MSCLMSSGKNFIKIIQIDDIFCVFWSEKFSPIILENLGNLKLTLGKNFTRIPVGDLSPLPVSEGCSQTHFLQLFAVLLYN